MLWQSFNFKAGNERYSIYIFCRKEMRQYGTKTQMQKYQRHSEIKNAYLTDMKNWNIDAIWFQCNFNWQA